jgi:hypothetical protein
MSWLHGGNIVTEEHVPIGAVGFVYKIIHIPTGRYYIGKKSLTSTRKLAPLKGQKRKRTVTKSSDWEKYYSSNDWIKEQVKEGKADEFSREIIQYCFSKKSLTYYEIYWQFQYNVLADDNAINENLMGKFYRRDLL